MFSILVIASAVTITCFCCGLVLLSAYNRHDAEVAERLQELRSETTQTKFGPAHVPSAGKANVARDSATRPTTKRRWLTDSDTDGKKNHARLVQAGIYNPSALFLLSSAKSSLILAPLLIGVTAGCLGFTHLRIGLLWGSIGSAIGMMVPSFWLESRIRHRHSMFRRTLADFLDLMIVCLEGGLSLPGTIQRVSDELQIAHPELAVELNLVQRDVALGATIDVALRRFADRTGYDGIRSLAACVRESQRYGTQLAEALRVHADMLRSQRENWAEEQAQKAAVKILVPMLLLILPAVFVVLAGPAAIQIQEAFAK